MMIVYIAGPMTGKEDYNRPAFNEAAEKLKRLGYTVLNPAILPTTLRKDSYMPICLAMVDACDVVALLPGWGKSGGASVEYGYAKYQGKKVATLEWLLGEEDVE